MSFPISSRLARIAWSALAALLAAALSCAAPVRAQATCGAAGGPPGASVCDYAAEALGVAPRGPATGAGNPIDLVTGNKYRREVDARGFGAVRLDFARHYNSRNRFAGSLGVGWSHSLETRIAEVRTGTRATVQVVQGDGRRLVFERDRSRSRTWRTAALEDGRIRAEPQGSWFEWAWHLPDGRTLWFDRTGRVGAVHRDGAKAIDVVNQPPDTTIGASGSIDVAYSLRYLEHPQGRRLEAVVGPNGDIARYDYDAVGQLAGVQWQSGRGYVYRYEDPRDPLLLTSVHERLPDGDTVGKELARYAYDAQGRAIATTEADGDSLRVDYALPGRHGGIGTSTVTDASGRVAAYRWTYDRHRHVARMLDATGDACASCPPAPRVHAWDRDGRLAAIETPAGRWSVERDTAGRPAAAAWRASGSGAATWLWRAGYAGRHPDARWSWLEQPSVAPGLVHRIEVERDRLGRPLAVTERGHAPAPGRGADRPWVALSRRFALEHAALDEGWPGPSRVGELTGLTAVDGPEPGPSDRIRIEVRRDERTVTLSRAEGLRESMRFRGSRLWMHESAGGLSLQTFGEDAFGGPGFDPTFASAMGPAGRVDVYRSDTGDPESIQRTDPSTGTSTAATVTDPPAAAAAGRVLATWRGRPTLVELADGSRFARGFDDFGRVAWIDEPGAPRRWAAWDATDRLVEHRPGDGSVLRYVRDDAGRLLVATREDAAGSQVLGRYRWDGPRLVEAANDTVTVRHEWDEAGRPTRTEHRFAAHPDAPLVWQWRRDREGRVLAEVLPDGSVVHVERSGDEIVGLRLVVGGGAATRISAQALRVPLVLAPDASQAPQYDPSALRFSAGTLVEAAGVRYLPDPHGRRAAKRALDAADGGADRSFVHVDWRLRAERLADGRLRQWIWIDDRPVAQIEDGRVFRLVTDDRRAPVRALRADGLTVWSARYDRNGRAAVSAESTLDVPLRLPGQYLDGETGLHHNHWRTYDPAIGRYLERDPLGLQPDWTRREDLHAYAGGDPVGGFDPWGLARLSFYAITTGASGRPIGRDDGFDIARWSFMVEDIAPVPLAGRAASPPQPAGIESVLFDPWGDFMRGSAAAGLGTFNGLDAIAANAPTGREVFAAFAAHYGGRLTAPERFVVDAFDDRRAGALAMILSALPSQRASCIGAVLAGLPGFTPGPVERRIMPGAATDQNPYRLLRCSPGATLPVSYRDDVERSRVERLQVAAELQESPGAAIGVDCSTRTGCRSQTPITVNGRSYWASYGRTQFTVTTFLAELMRMTPRAGDADAQALRRAVGLDAAITLEGRAATIGDALALARGRVDAAYRAFAALRAEFGRGVDAAQARALWDALPASRRTAFAADTGLGAQAFADVLGFVAGPAGRTEEEGRHALAAAAAGTVAWSVPGQSRAVAFDAWLVEVFSSNATYDHISRAFLRDNLRRVLAAPSLAGRFDNVQAPGTDAWQVRQEAIERDIARRVAVLHNSGRIGLATRPDLDRWLAANASAWVSRYTDQFVSIRERGDWETLSCVPGLPGGRALQMSELSTTKPPGPPPPPRPGSRP